jgi:hypothetical protein
MSGLTEAIRLIESQVAIRKARCVIADEGFPDESSLLGTRDGYLNMVLALLTFVAESDAAGSDWDEGIKDTLYQLPTRNGTFIVGAYLFKSHGDFMASLSSMVDPQIGYPVLTDPGFCDPGLSSNESK